MKINSKRILLTSLAAVAIAVGVTSCKKDLLNVNVPMKMADITFTIPVSEVVGQVVQEKAVETNIEKYLSDNKIKKENIKSIKIESITATIVPDSSGQDTLNNFRTMESIKGEMAVGTGNFFTVSEVTGNPDVAAYTLNLNPNTSTDFKDYLSSTSFKFRVTGSTRRPVTKPIVMNVSIKLNMEGGL